MTVTCVPRRRAVLLLALGAVPAACTDEKPACAKAARTESGSALHWEGKEVVLRLSPERPGTPNPPAVREALERAIAIWNGATSDCPAPRLVLGHEPLPRPAIRQDLVSEVLYHHREWCPPKAADFEDCYDHEVQASTRLRPERRPGRPEDGLLREADIEINGVDFRWSARGEVHGTLSLEVMFVHELGHVLGLDHPCGPAAPAGEATTGEASCSDPRVARAVMHPQAIQRLGSSEVKPLPGEISAVCAPYQRRD